MLDILGNVFGRSKKSTSSLNNSASGSISSNNAPDFSHLVSNPIYPTILTDELIKSPTKSSAGIPLPSSSSQPPERSLEPLSAISQSSQNSSVLTSLPFTSSAPVKADFINPMDNVPFVPSLAINTSKSSGSNGLSYDDSLKDVHLSLDRISHYLSSSSLQYNFNLERSVIQEYKRGISRESMVLPVEWK